MVLLPRLLATYHQGSAMTISIHRSSDAIRRLSPKIPEQIEVKIGNRVPWSLALKYHPTSGGHK